MRTTYSVICVLHGYVEQLEVEGNEWAALRQAKAYLDQGARCVEIYDASDDLVWQSEEG